MSPPWVHGQSTFYRRNRGLTVDGVWCQGANILICPILDVNFKDYHRSRYTGSDCIAASIYGEGEIYTGYFKKNITNDFEQFGI